MTTQFSEGQRVSHPKYGQGAIVHPNKNVGGILVKFDTPVSGNRSSIYVSGKDLTVVAEKAKKAKGSKKVNETKKASKAKAAAKTETETEIENDDTNDDGDGENE